MAIEMDRVHLASCGTMDIPPGGIVPGCVAVSAGAGMLAVYTGAGHLFIMLQERQSWNAVPIAAEHLAATGSTVTALCWLTISSRPCLSVGTSSGHLLLFGPGGACVLVQQVHKSQVLSLRFRTTWCRATRDCGSNSELIVLLSGGVVAHFTGADIRRAVAQCVGNYGPMEENAALTLPHRKWKLEGQIVSDAVCCGLAPRMLTEAQSDPRVAYFLLAAGTHPFVAGYTARCEPSVANVARDLAAKAARSATAAVANFATSFWSWGVEADETETQIPSEEVSIQRAIAVQPVVGSVMHDPTRRVGLLVLDPANQFVAATDSFGRVILIDVTGNLPTVVRMWKGYRDAQLAWVHSDQVPTHHSPSALLAIYMPRRGLLELWPTCVGSRLAALSVGAGCNLQLLSAVAEPAATENGAPSTPATSRCQCFLLGSDGELWKLVVPATLALPSRTCATPMRVAAGCTREQVLYRNFMNHLAAGAGEDALLKAIAGMQLLQTRLSALKAIAESQPSHSLLNWKATAVAVVELELAQTRAPSENNTQLLMALKRREAILNAFCVLNGDVKLSAPTASTHRGVVSTHGSPGKTIDEWLRRHCKHLSPIRHLLQKYFRARATSNATPHWGSSSPTCITFLRYFSSFRACDNVAGNLDGGAEESPACLVAQTIFSCLREGSSSDTAYEEMSLRRLGYALELLQLSISERWVLFTHWFLDERVTLTGNKDDTEQLLGVQPDDAKTGLRMEPNSIRWLRGELAGAATLDGARESCSLCQSMPGRAGHFLILAEIGAALSSSLACDAAAPVAQFWHATVLVARRVFELQYLLSGHLPNQNQRYSSRPPCEQFSSKQSQTLQLATQGAKVTPRWKTADNALLYRFPRHTRPSLLALQESLLLGTQWSQQIGRPWASMATALEAAADILAHLQDTSSFSVLHLHPHGDALPITVASYAQSVAAMLVWQRCIRTQVAALIDWFDSGCSQSDHPYQPHPVIGNCQGSHQDLPVLRALSASRRIARLLMPAEAAIRTPMPGTTLQIATLRVFGVFVDGLRSPLALSGEQMHLEAWLPLALPHESPTALVEAAALVAHTASHPGLHAAYLIMLEVLHAMAKHDIRDTRLSELFDFQSVPLSTNDGLPYAPLLTGDQAITNSNSDRCHAREQFLTKLVKYNDLTQALVLSVPWGFSPDKFRMQHIQRYYEQGKENEVDLNAEIACLSEESLYKLGVALLTVARQRLARIILATEDLAQHRLHLWLARGDDGHAGETQATGRQPRSTLLKVEEQQAQALLRILCTRPTQKQWLLAAGPAFHSAGLTITEINELVALVLACLKALPIDMVGTDAAANLRYDAVEMRSHLIAVLHTPAD